MSDDVDKEDKKKTIPINDDENYEAERLMNDISDPNNTIKDKDEKEKGIKPSLIL